MRFESFHKSRSQEDIAEAAEQSKNFEVQWDSPKKIEIRDQVVDLYDVSPERPKTGVPVTIMPGWSHTPEVWKKSARVLVGNGRRVLSLDAPFGVDIEPSEVEVRRVSGLLKTLESQNIERTDAIGQSLGAVDLLLAASAHPEKFRTLILVNPAGLIGKDSLLNLMGRFGIEKTNALITSLQEGTLAAFAEAHAEGTKSVLKNPTLSMQEALRAVRSDVVHLLRGLKEKGINIVIIHGVDDAAFSFARMSKTIHEQKNIDDRLGDLPQDQDGEILKLLDGVYSVKGGHEQFMYKAEDYTRLAEAALSAMERKAQKMP